VKKAPRNRTITLSKSEISKYKNLIIRSEDLKSFAPVNSLILGDIYHSHKFIPDNSVDLLFLDPPYNLYKKFHNVSFIKRKDEDYSQWFESWLTLLLPKLKETSTVYVCCDWQTSVSIYRVLSKYLIILNRITWEREKGRGAKNNFKNSHEDIWFAVKSRKYYFNSSAVKLKRKVIAPYRINGSPKDWEAGSDGNFRLTHAGNLWTDISIPFWSMPENTIHPTQKPEKLLSKLILASTKENDLVLDPFAGSGTAAVTAKKLNRRFYAIEISEEYLLLAMKRLQMAETDKNIQGFEDGVFWERNTLSFRKKKN
jgi:site-specific DNA-methyltransferase (adenine-specific)